MKPVFIISDNIVSPIALTANENFALLKKGISGIQLHHTAIAPEPFYASLFNEDVNFTGSVNNPDAYTKFEQLLIGSIQDALSLSGTDITSAKTALIISSTKGNISLIESGAINESVKKRSVVSTDRFFFRCIDSGWARDMRHPYCVLLQLRIP